ncbi:MAG TPA: alpha/beta fold hydrolase [Pseudonocardia sp.]|jgi:predicted dienelactone hydrolase
MAPPATGRAGYRLERVPDPVGGGSIPVLVLYPTRAPERPTALGRYSEQVAPDAPVAGGDRPLVVVSHGSGGSPLLHRTLAAHLARHGYVVALPEHPGNNRDDNSLAGTARLLAERPRQLRLVVDRLLTDRDLAPEPGRVALVGHSLGGYTALAAAGGLPRAFDRETADRQARAVPVVPDPRAAALVLLAPAAAWFGHPGALGEVNLPIRMFTAEHDRLTPPWHADVVRAGVPDGRRVEHTVVAGAGHYSFLSPFPAALVAPTFPPSWDPPGFNRARFHDTLDAEVLDFLRRVSPG